MRAKCLNNGYGVINGNRGRGGDSNNRGEETGGDGAAWLAISKQVSREGETCVRLSREHREPLRQSVCWGAGTLLGYHSKCRYQLSWRKRSNVRRLSVYDPTWDFPPPLIEIGGKSFRAAHAHTGAVDFTFLEKSSGKAKHSNR